MSWTLKYHFDMLHPKLRFPEFKENWNKKKLKDIAEVNPTNTELPQTFIYIDLESVDTGVLKKENLISKENAPSRAQRLLKENDILFQTVRPYQMNNLFFNKTGDYVASTGYAQIRACQNSKFLYQYLHFKKFVDLVLEKCTGTSYPSINASDLTKTIISIPSLPEQQKIASFLSTVDEKINLLKKQLSLLKQYKKGVMQKIFSREIRFNDEDGKEFPEWGEKKIKEIMDERNSQAPKSVNYPLMAFIAKKGVTPKGDRYNREFLVNDQENKKYKKTEYGDFIYSSNNLETGSIGLNKYGSATISPVYSIFKINELADFRFLSDYLSRKEFIYKMTTYRQGVVYGQWRIHESDFLQIKEYIPSVSEQKKIASFLSAIDEKIDKNEDQIRKMELWKKGLLQQMFI